MKWHTLCNRRTDLARKMVQGLIAPIVTGSLNSRLTENRITDVLVTIYPQYLSEYLAYRKYPVNIC